MTRTPPPLPLSGVKRCPFAESPLLANSTFSAMSASLVLRRSTPVRLVGTPVSEELDALRERKVVAVVDRVGGASHVALPRVATALAATARCLLSSEGAADLCARWTDVDVGDSAVAAVRCTEPFGLAHVGGEDAARQSLRDTVLKRDRFVEVVIAKDVEQGSEGLCADDGRLRRHGDDRRSCVCGIGRLIEEQALAANDHLAAVGLGGVHGRRHLVVGAEMDQRTDERRRLGRASNGQGGVGAGEALDEFVVTAGMDDDAT